MHIIPGKSGFIACALLGLFLTPWCRSKESEATRVRDVSIASDALKQDIKFTVVTPHGEPPAGGWPVLFILHGHGRNHRTLLEDEQTSQLLLKQPYLIVLPNGKGGWWMNSEIDTASRYESMLDEIVEWITRNEPVSTNTAAWGIAGWSMGGYGATRYAERHANRFCFLGSIIGLLDYPKEEGLPEGQRYKIPSQIFGKDPAQWETWNPIHAISSLKGMDIVLVLAEGAFDRTMNENFIAAAQKVNIPLQVHRIPGGHSFGSVRTGLEIILPAAAEKFAGAPN